MSNDGHVTDVSPTVHQGPDLSKENFPHVSWLIKDKEESSSITKWRLMEDGGRSKHPLFILHLVVLNGVNGEGKNEPLQ